MDACYISNEKELLTDLQNGNRLAFSAIYQKYSRVVYARLKALVHHHEIVQELHQDTFLKVWESRERLTTDVPLLAIIMRTAKSIAIDYYRKALRDEKLRAELIEMATELYDHVEPLIDFRHTNAAIDAAICKLPPKRLQIFNAIKKEGKTYERVAQELGISMSTVKDHMAKAMKFMRDEMSRDYPEILLALVVMALLKQ